MKNIYYLLFIFTQLTLAQTRVTSTGISIRAIARDEFRTSLGGQDIDVQIKLYTLDNSQKEYLLQRSGSVSTDDFGLFSYVLNLDENDFSILGDNEAYIEVSGNGIIYVEEKLHSVPYAIHAINAQNGFQTGSIIPYVGSTAPEGWLLCDGSTFTDDEYHGKLISILGTNKTPNLQAMFIRGAGSQTVPQLGTDGNSNFGSNGKTYDGGLLGTYHKDRYASHDHVINSLTGSPADDTNSSNWTGEKTISPGGFAFQYFLQRVAESSMNDGGAKKVADINSNANGTLLLASRGYGWDGAYGGSVAVGSTNDPRVKDINVNPHQHRVYGKTWYEPYTAPTGNDANWAHPPSKGEDETAPISYLVTYIIKI
ncbi:MAG: phage tail protein [Flavobacteriaceae bacterium]